MSGFPDPVYPPLTTDQVIEALRRGETVYTWVYPTKTAIVQPVSRDKGIGVEYIHLITSSKHRVWQTWPNYWHAYAYCTKINKIRP